MGKFRVLSAVGALAVLLAVGACAPDAVGPLKMDEAQLETWEIHLVEGRIEKNEAFMDPALSPLPAADIPDFEGLNYYFPDPALVFRAPLAAASSADTVMLRKRRGEEVSYLVKGSVSLEIAGEVVELMVYGPVSTENGDYLWLPFYDLTNQGETYPGGRYLDLQPTADGIVDVDFNAAYNPLCDYDPDTYNCTLPPETNRIPLAIEVGEKLFRPHS